MKKILLLGDQVSRVLCEALELDQSLLACPDAAAYHKPKKGIPDRELFEKKGHIYVEKK